MYDPAGDETGKEFIEIFNAGERVCNLEGVSVVDGSKSSNPFVFGSVSLASKSYWAIAQSRDIFIQTYTLDPGAYPFTFALNNTGEAVFLKDPSGNILDSVYIKKGTADFAAPSPWGALTAAEGKALRRKNPMIDTDSPIDFEAADPSPGM
jgi:hypothetical protein